MCVHVITTRVHNNNKNLLIIVIVVVDVDTPNLDKIQLFFCIGIVAAQVITRVVSAAEGLQEGSLGKLMILQLSVILFCTFTFPG